MKTYTRFPLIAALAVLVLGSALTACSPTAAPEELPAVPTAESGGTGTAADNGMEMTGSAPAEGMSAPAGSMASAESGMTTPAAGMSAEGGAMGAPYGEPGSMGTEGIPADLSGVTLSQAETEALLYMREEEKLARDVYLTLYQQWNLPIFQNIASSEQRHTDAVARLLTAYGLDDPAADMPVGQFVNADLQALYDQLTAQGSQSLAEALKTGAAIEEIDILDLETRLAQTDEEPIRRVFENLMRGSRNHLRAFTSTLEQQTGEVYQPQYLSAEAYTAIVNSEMEHGPGEGNGNGMGGGESHGPGYGGGMGGPGQGGMGGSGQRP